MKIIVLSILLSCFSFPILADNTSDWSQLNATQQQKDEFQLLNPTEEEFKGTHGFHQFQDPPFGFIYYYTVDNAVVAVMWSYDGSTVFYGSGSPEYTYQDAQGDYDIYVVPDSQYLISIDNTLSYIYTALEWVHFWVLFIIGLVIFRLVTLGKNNKNLW